jgi:DNA-binding MltR family transcriptional regulator
MAKAPSKTKLTKRPTHDDRSDPLTALEKAPDHALAITAAAYVDQALELLLRSRFRDLTTEEYERLFGESGNGVLATPAAKIRVGYAVGFYEKEAYSDLLLMISIRNAFAHSRDTVTFNSEHVCHDCRQLSIVKRRKDMYPDTEPFDARSAYFDTALDLCSGIQFDIRGDLAWAV